MQIETSPMTRFAVSLIHFYFVPPASQFATRITAHAEPSPEQCTVRPSRLQQHWTRHADGSLVASWQAI